MSAENLGSDVTRVSEASFQRGVGCFCGLLESSRDLGWTALLLDRFLIEPADAEYETIYTPDQAIVVTTHGQFTVGSLKNGNWRATRYFPGLVRLTPGGRVNRLRRRTAKATETIEMVKVTLPAGLLTEIAEEHKRPGQKTLLKDLDTLLFADPAIMQSMLAILRAVQNGACDLYAETAAQWLTTHLLYFHEPGLSPATRARHPGSISDRRLARVLEYIRNRFADRLTLDSLAREAGISKYHFVKLFKHATEFTPLSYLTEIRMQEAQRLLCTTELSVAEIAAKCGYQRSTHFATVFSARFGSSPSGVRAQQTA